LSPKNNPIKSDRDESDTLKIRPLIGYLNPDPASHQTLSERVVYKISELTKALFNRFLDSGFRPLVALSYPTSKRTPRFVQSALGEQVGSFF